MPASTQHIQRGNANQLFVFTIPVVPAVVVDAAVVDAVVVDAAVGSPMPFISWVMISNLPTLSLSISK